MTFDLTTPAQRLKSRYAYGDKLFTDNERLTSDKKLSALTTELNTQLSQYLNVVFRFQSRN